MIDNLDENLDNELVTEPVLQTGPAATAQATLDSMKGAFVDSLRRSNKQIRSDRAVMIAQKLKREFKRSVEDLSDRVSQLELEREAMLDLSPSNTQSLILAADFDQAKFVNEDLEIGIKIRTLKIKLNEAKNRYQYLFGETA